MLEVATALVRAILCLSYFAYLITSQHNAESKGDWDRANVYHRIFAPVFDRLAHSQPAQIFRLPQGSAVKTAVKIGGAVVILVIAAGLALPLLVNVNNFRPQIESNLSSALGRPVKIGNLSFSLFSGSLGADQLSIADDPKFSAMPFIQATTLRVGVEVLPLIFSKQLNVTKVVIDHPQIMLLRDRDGIWNFSSLGNGAGTSPGQSSRKPGDNGAATANVNIAKLDLSDGAVSLGSTAGKRNPIVYDKVNVTMRDFCFSNPFPVTASASLPGGGTLKIDGTAGPVDLTDTSLTPVQADVKVRKLDLSQSALVDPQLGIAGSADFDGTLKSDGRAAKAHGTLKITSLKIAAKGSPSTVPVQVIFAVEHDLKSETGKITQGDIAIGKALAKFTGTYDMHGETTSVRTTLNGQAMPVDDLEALLPALGVVLPNGTKLKGGMMAVQIGADGPLDKLVAVGWVRMSNSALTGLSFASKLASFSPSSKQSGNDTQIENLSCDLRHTPEGSRLDKINLTIPALGTVTGAGTISPSNELAFKLMVNLAAGYSNLLNVGGTNVGGGGIAVNVGGTTSNPTFSPDVKQALNNEIKSLTGGKGNPLTGLFGRKKPRQSGPK